jgi:hypothetical protein
MNMVDITAPLFMLAKTLCQKCQVKLCIAVMHNTARMVHNTLLSAKI